MIMIRYFAVFLSALLSACSFTSYSWQPASYDSHIVWADDNSELAIGTTFYEERDSLEPLMGATEKRRFAYRLFLLKKNGSDRRAISTLLPNQLNHLYYMKKAGYLLAESTLDITGAKQVHKIDLQGNATLIASIRPLPQDVCIEHGVMEVLSKPEKVANLFSAQPTAHLKTTTIPSPNGQLIAHTYRSDCQKINVDFYSPTSLTLLEKQSVEVGAGDYDVTWRKDGMLIVAKTDLSAAWQFSPNQKPTTTTAPHCFKPATRSSEVSTTGQVVRVDSHDIYVSEADVISGFGCQ